ncbi:MULTISPECIES: hypothetical protein [Flavobacterium]|uniref:Uncharacterized protein n=1 Tax=Flavobacterium keumense TaxID=1306518 RepID=A0ABY8N2P3_9FLAO|nr:MULTISPECIES: hypothetical protein [Flavobacterium]WGK93802.1 hypothetical protein MG292_06775 [Flavobacterium keumense]
MSHISDRLYNFITYGFTFSGIAVTFGDIKSFILFIGALVLLSLQIRLHLIKIKKEKEN